MRGRKITDSSGYEGTFWDSLTGLNPAKGGDSPPSSDESLRCPSGLFVSKPSGVSDSYLLEGEGSLHHKTRHPSLAETWEVERPTLKAKVWTGKVVAATLKTKPWTVEDLKKTRMWTRKVAEATLKTTRRRLQS